MPSASVPPPADAVDVLSRQRVADPDFWLTLVAWATVAFAVLQVAVFSFGRDQSIYAVIGEGILHGKMPYRDLWDFKPPGIFVIYGVAQALLGRTMLAPRLIEVAGLVGAVFAFRSLSHTFFGMRRVGLVGGAIAALIHAQLDFWHTGQPEAFGGFVTIYALALTVRDTGRRRAIFAWAGVGALFGVAFLLKPPLGGGALVCAAYLARREWVRTASWRSTVRPVLAVGFASLLPIAACALWFKLGGAWDALRWTFIDFAPGYTRLGWHGHTAASMFYIALEDVFFGFSALAAFGLIAAIAIRPMHTREREGIFLVCGVISIHVAGIAMQGKFFQYHYSATLPLIAFLGGLGLYKLWRRCLQGGMGGVIAFTSFVVVAVTMRQAVNDLAYTFWERSAMRTRFIFRDSAYSSREYLDRQLTNVADYNLDADRRVAIELTQRTAPDAHVFIWGFEPLIYWLSRREPASRFIYDVPQRVKWQGDHARNELLSDLARDPPAMIIVQRNDVFAFVTGDSLDSERALDQFPALDKLVEEQYEYVATVEDFTLYQKKAK